jgi:hypothetical protein
MGASTQDKPNQGKAQIQTWQAPLADWVQISTDGAYVSEFGNEGCGLLAKTTMVDGDLVFAAGGGVRLGRTNESRF